VGAVIITTDEDFVVRKLLETGPPVVWVRIGNTSPAITIVEHAGWAGLSRWLGDALGRHAYPWQEVTPEHTASALGRCCSN
jgi:hypothetical protein